MSFLKQSKWCYLSALQKFWYQGVQISSQCAFHYYWYDILDGYEVARHGIAEVQYFHRQGRAALQTLFGEECRTDMCLGKYS